MNRVLLAMLMVVGWFALCSYCAGDDLDWIPLEVPDDNITAPLPVVETDTPKATANVNNFTNNYVIDLQQFGISNNGTNAAATSAGINAALAYAAGAGYNYIQFPQGTYLIDPADPIELTLTNTIVDLNGAVLQMKTNTLTNCYIMAITYGAENLRLTNGTMKGDYTARGSAQEHVSVLRIESGLELEIDHIHFTDSAGFCVTSSKGMEWIRDFGYASVSAANLVSGGFSETGQPVAMADKCRTSQPYNVSGDFDGEFEFGYVFGYAGMVSIFDRNYRALFFDSSMHFLEARDLLQYKKYSMPANTKFIHLQFNQASATNQAEGMVGSLTNLRAPVDVHFHHNRIDNNASLGFAYCGGQRWIIEDCLFQNNGGGTPPHFGIDFEDGWELMQDVVVRNNRFVNNYQGDVVVCAGSELLFEGNEFGKTVTVWGRTYNYTFRNNNFLGGGSSTFATRTGIATIEKNTLKDANVTVKFDPAGFNDGLGHEPGQIVPTPPLVLRDCTLADIPLYFGTYMCFSGGTLTNMELRANPLTHMIALDGCRIVNSKAEFEATGPDVTYSVERCEGTLQISGSGTGRIQ